MVSVVLLKVQACDNTLVPFQGRGYFQYSNASQLLCFERVAEQLFPAASLGKVCHQLRLQCFTV